MGEMNDLVLGLENHKDRETAILGASILETTLEFSIVSHFPNINPDDRDQLFGRDDEHETGNLLSTFASRILFAHVIGVISDEMQKDLGIIKRIRNLFAHSLLSIEFDLPDVAPLCSALVTPSRIEQEHAWLMKAAPDIKSRKPGGYFNKDGEILDASKCLVVCDSQNRVGAYVPWPKMSDSKISKRRYVETVQVIWFFLMCHGAMPLNLKIAAQRGA
jgi:hypothetical protein